MLNNTTKYETPMGTFRTWEEAATACERADLDPCDCIKIIRDVPPDPPHYVSYEMGPGGVVRLSFQMRVF